MSFKERLKEARLRKKFTQEQLGELIGVAKSTITGYEKGNSEPDMMKMYKLMATLDVDANFLLQDEINSLPSIKSYSSDAIEVADAYELADFKSKNIARRALDLPELIEENPLPSKTSSASDKQDPSISERVAQAEEEYIKSLSGGAQKEASSASNIIEDKEDKAV